jgi:RND family efflux transporter MFP subunit
MGTVVSINVDVDQRVGKGSVLAQLDSRVLQQGLVELKTQLDLATTLYNKQKNLWDQGIGSEVQYLSAKANKESLEQRLATMQQQVSMYSIKSPINGTVDEVNVKVGSTVAPGLPAFQVVNLNDLVARAEIAESYGMLIRKGDEATVEFPDLKKTVTGKVSFVARTIDPMSRSFTVEVAIKNDDARYRPNMLAIVRAVAAKCDSCIVVPVNAVQTAVDGKFVMVAKEEGGKILAEKRMVSLGDVYKGQAVIIGGLEPGDRVIVKGYDGLSTGQPLIIPSPAADLP